MAFACNGRRELASRGREHRTPKRTKKRRQTPPKFRCDYWSKKAKNDSKIIYCSLINQIKRNLFLFYLLAGDGVGAVTAEDEELIIADNLIGDW